jgi:hypothetical protein
LKVVVVQRELGETLAVVQHQHHQQQQQQQQQAEQPRRSREEAALAEAEVARLQIELFRAKAGQLEQMAQMSAMEV